MGYCDKVVKYKYNNESLSSYCKKNKISYDFVINRIKEGIEIEEAVKLAHIRYPAYQDNKDLSVIAEQYKKLRQGADLNRKQELKKQFFRIKASEQVLSHWWEKIVLNQSFEVKQCEIWKSIPEYPNYQVSSYARFRRLNKQSTAKYSPIKPYRHQKRCRKNGPTKELLFVHLGSKDIMAKNIVAKAFVDNPNKYTCVRQKDGDWKNITPSNLEWLSASKVGKITGHMSKSKPVELVIKFNRRKTIFYFRSVRQCAKEMGVSYQMILDYLNKKTKKPKFKVRWYKEEKTLGPSELELEILNMIEGD